jgi:hypothetical protein
MAHVPAEVSRTTSLSLGTAVCLTSTYGGVGGGAPSAPSTRLRSKNILPIQVWHGFPCRCGPDAAGARAGHGAS